MTTSLSIFALVTAVLALCAGMAAMFLTLRGSSRALARPLPADQLPADTLALRQEVAALQAELAQSLRHLSVVRYDAFDDMGGELSWSLALVDDTGSGVVVSSINGRQHSRTYAKSLTDWVCPTQLSPQEQSAIDAVRP